MFMAPVAVFSNTSFSAIQAAVNPAVPLNVLQRLIGLWAFTMLFIQIVLGSFMPFWTQKLGGWIFRFHILEGVLAYLFILAHPTIYVFFRYFTSQGFDPFFVFTQVCFICRQGVDTYFNYGRIGFWLLTVGVTAGLLRVETPFMRMHWRKFHILNYFAFFFVWYHSLTIGTDIGTFPFSFFHGPTVVIIGVLALYRLYGVIRTSFRR